MLRFSEELDFGVPALIIILLCIPLVAATLALSLPFFTMLAWKNRYWGVLARMHYTVIMLSAAVFIWFLYVWNLLGFRF